MSYAANMKAQIIADLETLISASLGSVVSDDLTKSHPLDREFPALPAAVVIPPMISASEFEDVGDNNREYTWNIMVVCAPEAVAAQDSVYLENLMDAILQVFDNDCTLGGTAVAGVQPSVTGAGPMSHGDATYVVFYVTLKARALVPGAA